MFLRTAILFTDELKTDAELKAIMATHPWAPAMTHGFRRVRDETWEDENFLWSHSRPDAIYVDASYGFGDDNKWLVASFHQPSCHLLYLGRDEKDFTEYAELEKAWWRAAAGLLLHCIPEACHAHVVQYGEIVDEFEPGVAAKAWKETVLENCNYDPKVIAEFESTAV